MAEPEVLDPGVWRVPYETPTLPPATATNTLIVGTRRLAVVEPATPYATERAALDALLTERAAAGAEIVAVLVTHHHGDHIGYAFELAQRWRAPIYAHSLTAARVDFPVDVTLADGDRLELDDGYVLRALFTPGHAPGHLVYCEERTGIAYAGDLVAGIGTILIDPADGGDMSAYLDSLARLGTARPTALVPSHGPVIAAPQECLERYITHRRQREGRVLAALNAGATRMPELLAGAYSDTPREIWWLAERSLDAHLRKLEGEGRVRREPDGQFVLT
ncbi:Glyoxylase, beta-lactamase superfamily II [Nannocystis exedens]|uniref:Glyoxylase, beta-lactamase superfamily II n=1 Tax=Nannocystis exedens TaxID=54 RepID=A0A1I1X0N6_9BACT|nr:MBL fold metallo-hydrolase [Nannocystis exedens]PCC70875.1 MBL fold hydrolase [Nannocystis exedens]SFE01004.1 Glyoxylase, beta-lactamase superfamily II [Nannocystis exedens]